MRTIILSLLCLLPFIALVSCQKAELQPNKPSALFDAGSDAIDENYAAIKANLELIRKGLIDLYDDAAVTAAVSDLAGNQEIEDDFVVTFADLKDELYNQEYDLIDAMQTSILNHGGTSGDAEDLESIILAFTFDEVNFIPYIYIPFMDDTYFTQGNWDGETPAYVSTLFSEVTGGLAVVETDGDADILTEGEAEAAPIWIVGFCRVGTSDNGAPAPFKFWARCGCAPCTTCNVCSANNGTAFGSCGRTGLFSDNCSGQCPNACDGGPGSCPD